MVILWLLLLSCLHVVGYKSSLKKGRMNIEQHCMYSKVSIIRPGRSRLLEIEKKIVYTGRLKETFYKYPDQVV